MCRRRGLKVNAGKRKVMVMKCDFHVDVICLESIFSELKYLGCVLDESGTDGAECSSLICHFFEE